MFSKRVLELELSGIRKIFDLAQGDVINLGLGEPDFQPPEVVKEAIYKAVRGGYNKYGPSKGFSELRRAIADKYERYGDFTEKNVLITVGATEGLIATILSLVNPGDEVLYPNPGFVLYKPHTAIAGGKAVDYPIYQENGFVPDEEDLKERITDKTKAIILNYPNNPTGGALEERDIRMIIDLAEEKDMVIISDEVYFNLLYDSEPKTFLGKYDKLVFVNSFSKEFAMTGWRLGYIISPEEYVEQIGKIHYYTVACPQSPMEYAAIIALREAGNYTAHMRERFKKRRDLMYSLLNRMDGVETQLPRGAFYMFPKIEYGNETEIVKEMVGRGVLCTPGTAFGSNGEGHIRFSYAASEEDIRRGMEIFEDVLSGFSKK